MTTTLIPTVVLIPQWLRDDIAKLVDLPAVVHITDAHRASGWTPEMLAGGYLFITAYRAAVNAHAEAER